MEILLIAAMSANRVIGKGGKTPWHIPEELGFFKATTMGHPLIMGRATFDSLPYPLPGRRNIVLSRNPSFQPDGIERAATLEDALELCSGSEIVFAIGGAQIFTLTMPLATGILLSVLDRPVDGDTFFPEINHADFREVSRERHAGSESFTVITYRRVDSRHR
jgi:dihydrofolate reductase